MFYELMSNSLGLSVIYSRFSLSAEGGYCIIKPHPNGAVLGEHSIHVAHYYIFHDTLIEATYQQTP